MKSGIGRLLIFIVIASFHVALANTPLESEVSHVNLPSNKDMQTLLNEQKSVFENKTITINPLYVSEQNEFTEREIQKRPLENMHFNTLPLFIIGNDKYSLEWAITNAAYLQSIHALGIITHVKSSDDVKMMEVKTRLPLLPANINGLSKLIGTTHYPVLIYKNWVLQ